jgi:Flp pilus assembly protein TadG
MGVSLRQVLRRLRRDESGQSLVVIVLSMVVLVGMAAFGIDTATWMVRHHQAQIVADSAALAAAHCLANPGQAGSIDLKGTVTAVPACTSSSDTTDAQSDAIDYAAANGLTITSSNVVVNTTKDTVNVTAPAPSTAVFASMFGLGSTTQTAMAEAGWTTGASATCTTAGSANCSAIYAGDTSCGSGKGIQFGTDAQGGMQLSMKGAVHSEGVMGWQGYNVSVTASGLSVAGSCYTSGNTPSVDQMTATQVPSEPWPIDYRNSPYFTACTTACVTVTSSSGGSVAGVPSYCTNASTSSTGITFSQANGDAPVANNVYCAIGSGNPGDPTTWNGEIYIGGNTSGCQNDTFIGGNIILYGASDCFDADADGCVMYATDGSGSANGGGIELYDDTFNWTGTLFAPLGTIQLGTTAAGDGSASSTGLIEGLDVSIVNATLKLTGDGPPLGSSGSSSGGSDSLLQ